jgi:hypothetical protein
MGKSKVNITAWRMESPMVMANKMVACYMLQEIGVENLEKLPDEKLKELFLKPIEEEEDGKFVEKNEIDWEFVLFRATNFQLSEVFGNFQPKEKTAKPVSTLTIAKEGVSSETKVKERIIIEEGNKN